MRAATRKCLVWDLDDTLWQGVCLEGPVRVRRSSRAALEELDQRGILHSIASRGEREVSWSVLVENGLDRYFLAPQINWLPKPTNIAAISRQLNLSPDAIAFVDDDPFERAQVQHMFPGVLVLDATNVNGLAEREEFRPQTITPESRRRRELYQADQERMANETRYATRSEFLRACDMRLHVRPAMPSDVLRILELMSRTHQLNTTGLLFTERQVRDILSERSATEAIRVARLEDRFGDYGTVGIAIVKTEDAPRSWTLEYFAMSCRVLGRGVERAFICDLLRTAHAQGFSEASAVLEDTGRNRRMRSLYQMIGLRASPAATRAGRQTYRVPLTTPITIPSWISVQ